MSEKSTIERFITNCVSVQRRPVIRFTAVCYCIAACGENVFSGRVGFLAAAPRGLDGRNQRLSLKSLYDVVTVFILCLFVPTVAEVHSGRLTAQQDQLLSLNVTLRLQKVEEEEQRWLSSTL